MRVPPLVCAFPLSVPQLQSDWSLSCDHGLDYNASYCDNNSNNNNNNNNRGGNAVMNLETNCRRSVAVLIPTFLGRE